MFSESSLVLAATEIINGAKELDLLQVRSTLAIAVLEEPTWVRAYQETLVTQTIALISHLHQPRQLQPDELRIARERLMHDINQAKETFRNLVRNELASNEYKEFAQSTIDRLYTLEPEAKGPVFCSPETVKTEVAGLMQRFTMGMAQLPPYQILQTIQMYMDKTSTPEACAEYARLSTSSGSTAVHGSYSSLLLDAVKATQENNVLQAVYAAQTALENFNQHARLGPNGMLQSFPKFNY